MGRSEVAEDAADESIDRERERVDGIYVEKKLLRRRQRKRNGKGGDLSDEDQKKQD